MLSTDQPPFVNSFPSSKQVVKYCKMSDNFAFTSLQNFYDTHLRNQDEVIRRHLATAFDEMRRMLRQSNDEFLLERGDTPQHRLLVSSTPIEVEAARLCNDIITEISSVNSPTDGSEGDDECEGEDDSNANSQPAVAEQNTGRQSRARKRRRPSGKRPQMSRSPYPTRSRPQAEYFSSPIDSISETRRKWWAKKRYYKPKNLLSQIERAAESSTEEEAAIRVPSSSESEVQPVGLNVKQHIVDDGSSSSSSSVLEVDTKVTFDDDSTDSCDREVRQILAMDTLEASHAEAVAGSSSAAAAADDSDLEEGEIRSNDEGGSEDHGDDSYYDLNSPPFHMQEINEERIMASMPYILFCGHCSGPNSIKHIYDKFEEQREEERRNAEEAAEAARRVQEVQLEASPPHFSMLYPSSPPQRPNTPVSYHAVAPPANFTPVNEERGPSMMMPLTPVDNFGTPAANLSANCLLEQVRDRLASSSSSQASDKED